MSTFLYPYKNGSKSVAALKESMGIKVIKLSGSKYVGKENKTVINWGASSLPDEVMNSGDIINHPEAVKIASNKRTFFDTVSGSVSIPEYTDDPDTAKEWVESGSTLVVREKLSGHSGEGIVLVESVQEFENYPKDLGKLFVKYIPKKNEYRIHVAGGKVVDMARKAKSSGVEKVNWKIRSYTNGFVFVREDCDPEQSVIDEAIKAVVSCGLDFGAVDVIYNNYREQAYVLEVNTAPGLEGSTVDTYKEALENMVGRKKEGIKSSYEVFLENMGAVNTIFEELQEAIPNANTPVIDWDSLTYT